MPIKESSDELNPPVVIPVREIAPPKRLRTIGDYAALAIATCGVGYFPIAPGTMGSLVGVGSLSTALASGASSGSCFGRDRLFPGIHRIDTQFLFDVDLTAFSSLALSLVGIWAASRAERLMGRKDPSEVVIDEVAGQLVTFMFVPAYFLHAPMILTGFILFRAFDIIKPYPIRRVEGLHGGLGIVGDDIVAGLYAGAALALVALLAALHILP